MNWRNLTTVYLKELRDSLRDRRTLLSTIIIPTLVIPLMVFGVGKVMSKVMSQAQGDSSPIMIVGGEDSPGIVAALKAERDPAKNRPVFRVVPTGDYRTAIGDKKIRAAVEIPTGFEAALKTGDAPTVTIFYYEGEIKSGLGQRALEKFFTDLRQKTAEKRLTEHNLPVSLLKPFEVKRKNAAPPEKVGGNLVGGFVPYLIIILCFTGAMYPAMDLTAGEKERGTMETLLCSPVPRVDIVLGKFLMVLTGSVSAMVFMLLSMGTTAFVGGSIMTGSGTTLKVGAAAAKTTVDVMPTVDPMGLFGVLAMVLPVAVLFAAAAFTISLFAKSYKEAQSYLAPMMIVVIMPAVIGMLPGIDLNVKLAFVPILNLSLVCKEMLSGIWHWDLIAIIFGSSSLYAAIALMLAVKMFNREDVMFRA
ncbi:MAG: ABC transporter permease [Opitutae bacterium]|nr:ABC transporter permease [Opitutae bacterium]